MKWMLSIIICSLLVLNVTAENKYIRRHGTFTRDYENGNKKIKGRFQDNHREGKWEYWYESGERMMVEKYERDNLQGRFTAYFKNGNKKEQGDYRHNKKVHQWKTWYENGKLKSKGYYLDSLKRGEWKYYNPDGSVAQTVEYKDGKPETEVKKGLDDNYNYNDSRKLPGKDTKLPSPDKDDAKLKTEGVPGDITSGSSD